jgi:heme A synthase
VRPRAFARLATATAATTYLLIVMGGIVRVTGSGLGCGLKNDWPLCEGGLLPPLRATAVIEFTHRWIAALATFLVVALTVAAWLWQRRHRRITIASTVAAVLFVVQVALGALTVEYRLPGGIVMIHLANALLLLGVLTYIAVASRGLVAPAAQPSRARDRTPVIAAVATYLLALSGALVVETRSSAGCAGWPLCGGGFQLPAGQAAIINVAHRTVAGLVVLLVVALMVTLLRDRREPVAVRAWAAIACAVTVLQVAAGALVVDLRLPPVAQAVHLALAGALWATTLIVATLRLPALSSSAAWAAAATPASAPHSPVAPAQAPPSAAAAGRVATAAEGAP